MGSKFSQDVRLHDQEREQLVEELQLAKGCAVQSVRSGMNLTAAIAVRPADSMDRDRVVSTGTAHDLTTRSVVAQLVRPVGVGGFYELQLEDLSLGIPAVFGRCDRITMLAEERFEVRFQLLEPITLPDSTPDHER